MTQQNSTDRPTLGGQTQLGDRSVHRIGYGTMQLERLVRGSGDRSEALSLLRAVAEAGIDHFDTADFYTGVNALIVDALAPRRAELVINTKVGAARTSDGTLVPAQKPAELRAQVEANLRTLGTDRLDVVYLRRVDRRPGILAEGDQVVDIDDQLAEMVALRQAGKIAAIGLSAVSAQQLERSLEAGIAAVQSAGSLVADDAEPVLAICRRHGIAWVPFFPLGGALGGPRVSDLVSVQRVATELGATPSQVGLAWLLAHYESTLLIPGTTSREHLAENIAVGDLMLTPAQMEALSPAA